jgi:hypothetical protein
VRTIKKRGLHEKPGKRLSRGRNAGEYLSDGYLNKQRLINPLGVEVHESARLMDGAQSALPYKISRVLRGSLVAAPKVSPPDHQVSSGVAGGGAGRGETMSLLLYGFEQFIGLRHFW